jgi:hypothetical protein
MLVNEIIDGCQSGLRETAPGTGGATLDPLVNFGAGGRFCRRELGHDEWGQSRRHDHGRGADQGWQRVFRSGSSGHDLHVTRRFWNLLLTVFQPREVGA